MPKSRSNVRTAAEDPREREWDQLDRDTELCREEELQDALLEIYNDVERGFMDQVERSNELMDYWEIYNCKLGQFQYYSGTSNIYLPIVHNAINARVTRFSNQVFPQSGRNVEVISSDGSQPHAVLSIAEHYIRRSRLRTRVIPALLTSGDIEGQYTVYLSWQELHRYITWRAAESDEVEGVQIVSDEYYDMGPHVEVINDSDLLVLPFTSDTVEEAIENGGIACIVRRWTKAKIRRLIKSGDIDEEAGETLLETMTTKKDHLVDTAKKMSQAAGINTGHKAGPGAAIVYEVWTKLLYRGERRLCVILYGGEEIILSCRRSPYWNDRCPILSVPLHKVRGSFKGISKIRPCAQVQYYANDAVNEAADSSMYALSPIVMTDPEKNPRTGSMVMSMAAIWECDPRSTQFAQMPELWKQGFEIVSACKAEIAQSLSVSPAAITQSGQTKIKQSQADIAREQQVDILSTADSVTVLEEGILTPLVNWFIELDHQFRDSAMQIPQFGEMGRQLQVQMIEPIQMGCRYFFKWYGVEAAKTAQQVQQQIAMVNVLRGIPPQQYEGYQLDLKPLLVQLSENAFGPRLAPLIFKDMAAQMPVPAEQENLMLVHGFEVPTHMMDDDNMHIQSHMALLNAPGGGNKKKIQSHVYAHIQQQQRKQAMAMQAQMPQIGPPQGGPGGGGGPRIGAQPAGPRMQGPPGMMPQDQVGPMSGGMPRLRQAGGV